MDYDSYYNSLSFDDKLLNEKLGLTYSDPYPKSTGVMSLKERIDSKLNEQKQIDQYILNEHKMRKEKEFEKILLRNTERADMRRTAKDTTNLPVEKKEGFTSIEIENDKFLFILLIIICVCVFMSLNNKIDKLENMISLSKQQSNDQHPATLTPKT